MAVADVRVKDAQGHTFKFTREDADKFMAANPGSAEVQARAAAAEAPAPVESAGQQSEQVANDSMTREELNTLASEMGIDGAEQMANKDAVIAAINGQGAAGE